MSRKWKSTSYFISLKYLDMISKWPEPVPGFCITLSVEILGCDLEVVSNSSKFLFTIIPSEVRVST